MVQAAKKMHKHSIPLERSVSVLATTKKKKEYTHEVRHATPGPVTVVPIAVPGKCHLFEKKTSTWSSSHNLPI